jgi:hypothetical protein
VRSLFNDVYVMVDADQLRVWAGPDADARCGGAPCFAAEHGGEPAELLARALADLPKARPALRNRVQVLLAHPWAQGVVLPWQDGLCSSTGWDAYGRALLEPHAPGVPLSVRVAHVGFGRARLAIAVREDLLGALAEASRAAGWTLTRCRDLLSFVLREYAARRVDADCRIALLQPGALTCLFRRGGEWADLVTLPSLRGQRVSDLLDAAALVSEADVTGPIYLYAHDAARVAPDCGDAVLLGDVADEVPA